MEQNKENTEEIKKNPASAWHAQPDNDGVLFYMIGKFVPLYKNAPRGCKTPVVLVMHRLKWNVDALGAMMCVLCRAKKQRMPVASLMLTW